MVQQFFCLLLRKDEVRVSGLEFRVYGFGLNPNTQIHILCLVPNFLKNSSFLQPLHTQAIMDNYACYLPLSWGFPKIGDPNIASQRVGPLP